MKSFFLALFALCFVACIDEYSDTIVLQNDGSATFLASVYPCEPDSSYIENIKSNYKSIEGLKLDSVWLLQKDSLYSLNFRLTFENLLSWQGDKKFEKDFIGNISLKKIDKENGYSFERVVNYNAENEDGSVVPEEGISPFALEQISGSDSAYWEYVLVLPQGAKLINSETDVLRWRFPAEEALTKRIVLKADFTLPPAQKVDGFSLLGIILCCIIMLLAIALLMFKLKKLSKALKTLKEAEQKISD
ncbi:MAG: hypothetical protein LBU89_06505 [Fibromonadaceae bacterium]|jgi:hypothetical protein|nr:hypothetical protein [Fibromonadaceae bacterium]